MRFLLSRRKSTPLSQKFLIFCCKRKSFRIMSKLSNRNREKFWRKNEKNDEKKNKEKSEGKES